MTQDYYGQVANAFDRAAPSYQTAYGQNPIVAWLAEDTFAQLCRIFPEGDRLLEIGCGPGDMAVRFAGAGREVVATDISPAMICEARSRAADATGVSWVVSPAGELNERVQGPFDGAYSNFGPLNCEPDLSRVARWLGALVLPGGAFVCSVMNRWCAWEIGWELLRLHPRAAARRLGPGWRPARMSAGPGEPESSFPVRFYSPSEFARPFRGLFTLETCLGYPAIIPPPYLAGRWPRAAVRLDRVERRLRGWPGFRSLGDHFMLILRRTQAPASPLP